jgi:hypothetical protein
MTAQVMWIVDAVSEPAGDIEIWIDGIFFRNGHGVSRTGTRVLDRLDMLSESC